MIDVAEAKRLLIEDTHVLDASEVGLEDALGRTLAEEIPADRDLPPSDVSTMDGFAVRAADVPEPGAALRIAGEVRAGQPLGSTEVGAGCAVRILTGAALPPGADAVVMVERTREDVSTGTVLVLQKPEAGQNIRRRGEDILAGQRIVDAGVVLHAAEIAALSSVGRTRVRAIRPPLVHIVSTGDEVVEPDRTPEAHQVRNSNAHGLRAQLRELGIEGRYVGIAADERGALEGALRQGLAGDVLLVTGGVSMGTYDLVGETLTGLGMRRIFHGVAVRPGKPILAGRCGSCLVVGLPGNPVSTFTGFAVFVAPVLRRMMGYRRCEGVEVRAVLADRLKRRPDRTTYHLARLEARAGRFVARPIRSMGSGDVISLVRANAFVVTEAASGSLEPGAEVTAIPWKDFDVRW